jgi:hypothetical protein
MRKFLQTLFFIQIVINLNAQQVFFKTGKNYTNYNFSSLSGIPVALQFNNGDGQFYEFGFSNSFKKVKNAGYKFSLNMNDYNALAHSTANFYEWNTTYVGVQGVFYYRWIQLKKISSEINAGLLFNKMIYGKQIINKAVYDLHSNNEFNGILVHPVVGTNISLERNDWIAFVLGYQFSFSSSILQNRLREQTSFINHQIQFGIQFKL